MKSLFAILLVTFGVSSAFAYCYPFTDAEQSYLNYCSMNGGIDSGYRVGEWVSSPAGSGYMDYMVKFGPCMFPGGYSMTLTLVTLRTTSMDHGSYGGCNPSEYPPGYPQPNITPPPATPTPDPSASPTPEPTPGSTPAASPTPASTATPEPTPEPDPTNLPDAEPDAEDESTAQNEPTCKIGSILLLETGTLGEVIPIANSKFNLTYFSDRVPGRRENFGLQIPLTASDVRGIQSVRLEISIGDRVFANNFSPTPNLTHHFVWDGKTKTGNVFGKTAIADIRITYTYLSGNSRTKTATSMIGGWNSQSLGLGGWQPSNLHYYDHTARKIILSTGLTRKVEAISYKNQVLVPSIDGSEAYVFDQDGKHIRTQNALTSDVKYTFVYDAEGRLSKITTGRGKSSIITYSSNRASIVDAYGVETKLSFDSNGWLSTATDPEKNTFRISTSSDGLITSFQKPSGSKSNFSFDNKGRLKSDISSGGSSTRIVNHKVDGINWIQSYTSMGRATSIALYPDNQTRDIVSPDGSRVRTYDNGRDLVSRESLATKLTISSSKSADARFGWAAPTISTRTIGIGGTALTHRSTNQYVFDFSGSDILKVNSLRVLAVSSEDQRSESEVNYEGTSRLAISRTPEGRTSKVILNHYSQVSKIQTGELAPTEYTYDSHGKLIRISRGARQTQLEYDSRGNLRTFTDPTNRKTHYVSDKAGKVLSQSSADGSVVNFSYNANGKIASITPASKSLHRFEFNAMDLVSRVVPPSTSKLKQTSTSYAYNADKQLSKITTPDGRLINYSYDIAGRVVSVSSGDTSSNYTYDLQNGLLASVSSLDGNQSVLSYVGPLISKVELSGFPNHTIEFNYNPNLKTRSIGLGGTNQTSRAVDMSYDKDGLLTAVGDLALSNNRNAQIDSVSVGKFKETRSYSNFGELSVSSSNYNGKNIFKYELTRDNAGRVIRKTENYGNRLTVRFDYVYDQVGRLSQTKTSGIVTGEYSYDSNGNRVATRKLMLRINAKFDEQDRITSFGPNQYEFGRNGSLTAKSDLLRRKTLYSHDSLGNLKRVTLPNGKVVEYLVDGFGRRVAKKINGKFVAGYIWQSQNQLMAVTNGSGEIVSRFIYASKINVPDMMLTNHKRYKIVSDQIGSVRALIDLESGKSVGEAIYDDFGIAISNVHSIIPIGFAGGLVDTDTGLIHFGARDYDPEIGRFISKDPTLFAGMDTNLYNYALQDPINFVDFNGKNPFLIVAGLIAAGGAAGAAGNFIGTYYATSDAQRALDSMLPGFIAGGAATTAAITAYMIAAPSFVAAVMVVGVDVGVLMAYAFDALSEPGSAQEFRQGVERVLKQDYSMACEDL